MNTNLMMQVATLSKSVEEAMENVTLCQKILDVLTSATAPMRVSQIAEKCGYIVTYYNGEQYPRVEKVTHWLKVLRQLDMVKREEQGTEIVQIGYWGELRPKEVPIAWYSLS